VNLLHTPLALLFLLCILANHDRGLHLVFFASGVTKVISPGAATHGVILSPPQKKPTTFFHHSHPLRLPTSFAGVLCRKKLISLGCHPLDGLTRGAVPVSPSDATVLLLSFRSQSSHCFQQRRVLTTSSLYRNKNSDE